MGGKGSGRPPDKAHDKKLLSVVNGYMFRHIERWETGWLVKRNGIWEYTGAEYLEDDFIRCLKHLKSELMDERTKEPNYVIKRR